MFVFYRVLTVLLYPIVIIFIYLRKVFKKEDPIRFKEKIFPSFFNVERKLNSKLLWFHAASLGEFKSILPIIEKLQIDKNNEFLITTVSYSSGKFAEEELKNFKNIRHRYFPIDIPFIVKKFIELWKPESVFFIDSEIWPNFIKEIKKKKIPLALINARITRKSFNRWKRFSTTSKQIFGSFDLSLACNTETQTYLEKLNAKNIFYVGNIKLINSNNLKKIENINQGIFEKKKSWLAASTHEGEEILCLNTHKELKKEFSQIITIIAPRHIKRVNQIKNLCDKSGLSAQILNKNDVIQEDKEIILINSFGSLPSFYKFMKSVFIGKSTLKRLIAVGGQNPIEAVRLGCKIYHGPFVYNFKEIYQILSKNNISKEINNEFDLSKNLILDLKSEIKDVTRFSKIMNEMENKTLNDTMFKINSFLSNENL